MTQYEKLNFVNGSPPALSAATLNHMEDGIAAATDGVTALEETVAEKSDKATTLGGYGITDTYTKTETDEALLKKLDDSSGVIKSNHIANGAVTAIKIANNAISGSQVVAGAISYEKLSADLKNTLAQKAEKSELDLYEKTENKVYTENDITDPNINYPSIAYLLGYYYDYNKVDELLSGKLDNVEGSVTTENIAREAVTTDKIANGTITTDKLSDDVIELIGSGGGGSVVRYLITYNLINVASSNGATSIIEDKAFTSKLIPDENYIIGTPVITMNGIDITSDCWDLSSSTINIRSVTGDIVITCSANKIIDTSPIIAGTGALDTKGGVVAKDGLCYTDFYDLVDGAKNITMYMADLEGISTSGYGKLQCWNANDECTSYWSATSSKNTEHTYAADNDTTRFRTTLFINGIDDSYAYDSSTGHIYFAGKNTKYYGLTNINGSVTSESVAELVDNQIAMLSLGTGETVDTFGYSGLSSDYVTMVQSNYNEMMAECLGDYNKIPIIVHTDQHGRIGATNQVIKLIGDMVNWYEVSKCLNLGDTVSNTFNADLLNNYLTATKDSIPLSKRIEVYGNHDVWDSDDSQRYTVDQKRLSPYFKNIYARRRGNNGYFTVIDDYYNVKYLVINNLEYLETNTSKKRITSVQADFIISELSKNDGRDIILVSHVPLDEDEVISRDSSYTPSTEKLLSDSTAQSSFMDMIKARKNKTAGTFTDSEGVEHTYDFGGVSSDLLMSLHGHSHFEAYKTFENSITEFMFDWFDNNTFYFGYIDRENKKFKCWKNEADVEALEISIA